MKNPFYAAMAAAACLYLALSNARGWSALHFANPTRWGPAGARMSHK